MWYDTIFCFLSILFFFFYLCIPSNKLFSKIRRPLRIVMQTRRRLICHIERADNEPTGRNNSVGHHSKHRLIWDSESSARWICSNKTNERALAWFRSSSECQARDMPIAETQSRRTARWSDSVSHVTRHLLLNRQIKRVHCVGSVKRKSAHW